MSIVFCLPRRPKSLNAKLNSNYRQAIHQAGVAAASGGMLHGHLYSRVVWFHRSGAPQVDVDNILKPIHDALKGAVYQDDDRIVRAAAFRVDISRDYIIDADPSNPEGNLELLGRIDVPENNDILYIEIGSQPDQNIRLGPVQ